MDHISETRLAEVHPRLAAVVRSVGAALAAQGIYIRVTSGVRGEIEQTADYAKGRSPDMNTIIEPHAVVTHARYGYSAHNFGMAVDVVPGVREIAPWLPNWNTTSADFQDMVKAFESAGLIAGITWAEPKTDPDHFQLDGQPVTPTAEMRGVLLNKGISAVWTTFAPEGLA